uniref:Resistance to inhibitors of cholinesterase protein 3 N-terminal domain-containing protein n=1 Tax=Clastoptera arizonana TaxID=38151 RepID=A0A1B6CYT3_9HEMI
MATEFGTGKSVFILAIVLGCFAVLWPKIFYPMLQDTVTVKPNIMSSQEHIRQERPSHLHPDTMHPALREKGRAITIPPEHIIPKVQEREAPSKPMPPMPGMRPPMGGAGHVVPAPKGSGTMGIVMPLYTIGIVIFFMYTMMKLIFKKSEESSGYKNLEPDPEFRRVVFNDMNYGRSNIIQNTPKQNEDNKLVFTAISGLVAEVNRSILSEQESEEVQAKDSESDLKDSIEDSETKKIMEKGEEEKCAKVQVVGMEMTESIEGGQRWSRPPTPLSRGATPIPPQQNQEPQHIFLEGSLPSQSQLLVSQSETQTLPPNDDDDSSVILAGKVTLSLIGLDAGLKADIEEQVISDYDEEEEEEEDEVGDEEVSDDDAEVEDGVNGDEDPTTNYTTASVIGPDETAAEFSLADALAQDVADEENEIEYDEGIVNGQEDSEEEEEEEEGEEEEEEEEEEEDEQEEQRQPQIDQQLSSQHQR